MKYLIITLCLCMILGLTACGSIDSGETDRSKKTGETSTEPEIIEGTEEGMKEPDVTEASAAKADEQESETKQNAAESSNKVDYSYKNIYMSIDLPQDWDSEIQTAEEMEKQEGMTLCGIDFWSKENPELKFELGYWADGIGMCGTGVKIEEISFDNGLSATQYTESIQGTLWLTIIYDLEGDGAFVVQGDIPEELWTDHQEEVMELLETVVLKS